MKDTQKLSELNVDKTGKIYFKDLGPQIGWSTVKNLFFLIKKKCLIDILGIYV